MKPSTIGVAIFLFMTLVAGSVKAPAYAAALTTVFSTDFESGLPPEFSAPGAMIEPVQGYAGLGPLGNQFSGNFLRYSNSGVFDTILTLTGLPTHRRLSVKFLLALIDSWDGVELLEIRVDGDLLFSHSFQLATGDSSSYAAPEGGLLSSGTDLGFSAGGFYDRDRAYDMSVEPAFLDLAHSADSVSIVWSLAAASGGGAPDWQGGADESWAIENVRVEVDTSAGRCSQPVSTGETPTATDCLFILNAAVGALPCDPECICAPKGSLPIAATDALVCLNKATGIDVELDCPCMVTTTSTSTTSTSTSISTTTTSTTTTTLVLP